MFSISFSNSEESQRQLFLLSNFFSIFKFFLFFCTLSKLLSFSYILDLLLLCMFSVFPLGKNHNIKIIFCFYISVFFIFLFFYSLSIRKKKSKLTYYLFSPNLFLFFETFYFYAPIQNFCYSSRELILKL